MTKQHLLKAHLLHLSEQKRLPNDNDADSSQMYGAEHSQGGFIDLHKSDSVARALCARRVTAESVIRFNFV